MKVYLNKNKSSSLKISSNRSEPSVYIVLFADSEFYS